MQVPPHVRRAMSQPVAPDGTGGVVESAASATSFCLDPYAREGDYTPLALRKYATVLTEKLLDADCWPGEVRESFQNSLDRLAPFGDPETPLRPPTADEEDAADALLLQLINSSSWVRTHSELGEAYVRARKTLLRWMTEGREVTDKTYTVDLPAGVDTGSTLRLSGFGAAGLRGGGKGDLYVHVRVRPHPRFTREGQDLHHELHLPVTQAALGAVLGFETLDGDEELVVPRGTQNGRVFRLRGKGVPHVRGRGRGDLLVHTVVDTPTELSAEVEEALRAIAAERGEDVAPPDKGLISRLKSRLS